MIPTSTLQKLREHTRGFTGRFFYDAERGDIAYIAKKCDERTCDCERKLNSDGEQDCSVSIGDYDEEVAEPIVAMLNAVPAVPALLAEIEQLQRDNASWANSDFERQLSDANAEIERLRVLVQMQGDAAHRERDEARAEAERLDAALSEEIDERDARLKQIDDIADALGDEGEWSNLHDRGQAAYELASGAVAEVGSLRAENKRLLGLLAIEHATVGQVMDTQRSEATLHATHLSTLRSALGEACDIAEVAVGRVASDHPLAISTRLERITELRKAGW